MYHIVRFLLAKVDDILVFGKAADTLAKGVVRWVATAAPGLAIAVVDLAVGAARRAAWNALDSAAALGSLTTGLMRWLGTAGRGRWK